MKTKKFPSDEFPEFPNIEVTVASEEWRGINSPESVIALLKDNKEGFSSNVLINIKKVKADYDLEESKNELFAYIKEFDKLNIFSDSIQEIDSLKWQIEEFVYIDKKIGALAQISAVTFVVVKEAKFLISFTGTTDIKEEKQNKNYLEMQDMLSSVKVVVSC